MRPGISDFEANFSPPSNSNRLTKISSVSFVENGEKKFIMNYTIQSNSNILDNAIFVIIKLISNILYAEVAKYKKFIIYDHLKKEVCSYTNDLKNFIKNSTTHILAVWSYPSKLLNVIEDAILENERSHFKVLN